MDLAQLPFDQPHPLRMPLRTLDLQSQGLIHRIRTATGAEAWLVTSYSEIRRLLTDERLGQSHPDPDNAARTGESAVFGGPMGDFETEHADHAKFRAMLQPFFSPRQIRALRPRVEELTTQLLDDLTPPVDLIEAFAAPLPILVICELLGVPYADRDQFRAWSKAAADVTDQARSLQGLGDLFGYGNELVARKRREPADDLITQLCATSGLPDDKIAELSMGLLFAGHETTVAQIGMGTLALLTNPEQWQALLADPSLIPNAVEEIMRVPGDSSGGIPRYARTDLEIDGVTVSQGDLVLLDVGAGNHDPTAFADPYQVDVARETPAHLSFGHGTHYCVGAPLARLELQTVFAQLIPRFPTMRLAVAVGQLRLRRDLITALIELPVVW